MEHSDNPEPLGPGTWRRTAHVENERCCSATPCCNSEVAIPLSELSLLGYVTLRCPACAKPWELRYDPWKSRRDAIWID